MAPRPPPYDGRLGRSLADQAEVLAAFADETFKRLEANQPADIGRVGVTGVGRVVLSERVHPTPRGRNTVAGRMIGCGAGTVEAILGSCPVPRAAALTAER